MEIWLFVTTWMKLKGIMLTKISQTNKGTISFKCLIQNKIKQLDLEKIGGCQKWEWELGKNGLSQKVQTVSCKISKYYGVGDAVDSGSIPGLRRSSGRRNGNPLQWIKLCFVSIIHNLNDEQNLQKKDDHLKLCLYVC